MELAPIVVFAYKRPAELQRMLRSLVANPEAAESHLIIFCDGPKANATDMDRAGIEKVRTIVNSLEGFGKLEVIEAPENKGLARSVIDGVTYANNTYGRVIVVEDDAVLSPHFLHFMNGALNAYASHENVFSVGSWNYYADPKATEETYFIRYPDSLAWATWKRSWDLFEQDGAALLSKLKKKDLLKTLDGDGNVKYFSEMLKAQVDGKIDSWAIRWTASCVLHGKLNVFPRVSVALNRGFGESATHEKGDDAHFAGLELANAPVAAFPQAIKESEQAFMDWVRFVRLHFEGGSDTSLKTRIWRVLPTSVQQWNARRKISASCSPKQLEFEPVSRLFGFDRGLPVDRFYIEAFLQTHQERITGRVMEIEEPLYTNKFGENVKRSTVLKYTGNASQDTWVGDLTKPETLPDSTVDVFICTQTLNFIYEHHAAVRGIYHVLEKGGVAIVTVAGLIPISRYDADRWGDYWRYTPQSALRMFEDVFGKGNVEVVSYGNSYATACLAKGFAFEECDVDILNKEDADHPVVIGILANKRI
ncbi:MAG: glycosyltransferase [Flavobacteriales bacterium]|nr:glycosyltransferase [Flavobacteriales bacterium]